MILNDVHKGIKKSKRPKRVGRGRGSGHGKTCCRGHKGSKSRSGSGGRELNEGGQMPLFRRIPKCGFNNKWRTEYSTVNVGELNRFKDDEVVTPERLFEERLVRKRNQEVKILGNGSLERRLTVSAHKFSASAAEKIRASGGTVKEVVRTAPKSKHATRK
jgi:large subunit ribosomal protein L15